MPSARATCLQIATKVEGNPIMQDEKKGKARLYHGPIFWNYGCLPQTWEDPNVKGDADVGGAFGDDDPVDVVEIGAASQEMGAVVPVKPLGVLSMIDDGEVGTLPLRAHLHKRTTHGQRATIAPHCCHALPLPSPTKAAQPPRARPWHLARQLDWKVIAISASDEHAKDINDVGDIEKYYPGTVSGIREWFRWYKTPDGVPPRPPASPGLPAQTLERRGGGRNCPHPCPHPCRSRARRQAGQRLRPQRGGAQRGQGGRGDQGDQRALQRPDGGQDRRGQALAQVEWVLVARPLCCVSPQRR